ncbi:MAG: hypothetical protein N2558_02180 [Patescibacteria group bacterium]|nr:hypothetical protein [Patescibacteria group bacterium]
MDKVNMIRIGAVYNGYEMIRFLLAMADVSSDPKISPSPLVDALREKRS